MIAILHGENDLPPENPTHQRLIALANRIEAGEADVADDLLAEIERIEGFLDNLPELSSEVASRQAELFAQALEGYLIGAMQLDACLKNHQLCTIAQARAAFAAALAALQRSKSSIEDDWETPLEVGL